MSRSRKKNPYRGSRRFDKTCRNHGSCPWCTRGRLHQEALEESRWKDHLQDHQREGIFEDLREALQEAIAYHQRKGHL